MSELQATLEFSVELNKFYNVDLFQRGYYQVRTALKTPPKVPSKIEITLQKSQGDDDDIPAHVINEMAVSRTFQILYRNEDVSINDVILYRFHTLINSGQMEEELAKLEIQLVLELWFAEESNGTGGILSKAECVSTRQITIHFNPMKGLHHHVPILFDYFHLCCLEVTCHATLIAIHQPFLSVPKQPRSAWSARNPELSTLESVYFGDRPISAEPEECLPKSLHAAWQIHHRICNMLLSAYESLQSVFEFYLSDLCGSQFKLEHIDCHQKLQRIMDGLRDHDNEEELIQNATRDITQLCAANVILWTQFLETATLEQGIIFHLAREHHSTRVKRLAEAFFTFEYQKNECLACYEPSYHGHQDLASMVRSSMYLQTLPPLDLECLELDGDCNTLPIIFEDIYFDQTVDQPDTGRSSCSGSLSPQSVGHNTSPVFKNRPKRNFIKNIRPDTFKRPSSFNLQEAEAAANSPKQPKEVVLIGYRKTTASPNVHSKVIEKSCELGTFSPIHMPSASSTEVPVGSIGGSMSMPALNRTDWIRNSDGTLPEYMQVARRSLRAKKKRKNRSLITVDFGGSDPSIQNESEDEDEGLSDKDVPRRLHRANTDPVRPVSLTGSNKSASSESSDAKSKPSMDSQRNKVDNSQPRQSSKVDTSKPGAREESEKAKTDQPASKNDGSVAKKQLDFQDEMYRNLADCLTQALGDSEELHDSDKSDDETCVQNGFDAYLEEGPSQNGDRPKEVSETSQHSHQQTDHVSSSTTRTTQKSSDAATSSGSTRTTGLTVRDVLKINALHIQPSGQAVQTGRESQSNISMINGKSACNNADDVLGISGINYKDSGSERSESLASLTDSVINKPVTQTCSASLSDSGITLTGSQSTLSSRTSEAPIHIITEHDLVGVKEGDQLTVFELLKEEYKRHSVANTPEAEMSVSEFGDSGISGMSMKNNYKASSDSNILAAVDTKKSELHQSDLRKPGDVMVTSASFPDISKLAEPPIESQKLVNKVGRHTVNFISMREHLKTKMKFQGHFYSLIETGECPTLASEIPYFHVPDSTGDENQDGCHLVVCVHGLDGNCADLRLVKTYMEMALPGYRLEFLMSERNQTDTFAEFDTMTNRLVSEIINHIDMYSLKVARLSFIGHSLGTIIIRSALTHRELIPYLPKLYTFLSLSGPHLGTLYNNSGLVNMGMWFIQKWKKSGSLLQLSLKDHLDPRLSFLYKLSQKPGLEFFRHVLLVGSSQDRYVPYHSSRIEMCKAAQRESTGMGSVYAEMVANILQPIVSNPKCKLIRYDVFHALPSTANTIIGRAAHIAVLDSEIFIEKFLMVCGLKYFK